MHNGILKSVVFILIAIAWQPLQGQVRPVAGVSYGRSTIVGYPDDARDRAAWRIGGGAIVPLSRSWSMRPMLYYSLKGARMEGFYGSEQVQKADISTTLHYLELPLYLAGRVRLGGSCGIVFKAGPYVACALTGRNSVRTDCSDRSHTLGGNVFGSGYYDGGGIRDGAGEAVSLPRFRRFEAGWATGIDLEAGRVLAGIDLSYGLTPLSGSHISNNAVGNILTGIFFGSAKPRNMSLNFNIGYIF